MKIVILGGYDRYEPYLKEYAKKAGIDLTFLSQPKRNMENLFKGADYIVILTRFVSHEMMKCAKACAPEKCIYCKQAGLCTIKRVIEKFLLCN